MASRHFYGAPGTPIQERLRDDDIEIGVAFPQPLLRLRFDYQTAKVMALGIRKFANVWSFA